MKEQQFALAAIRGSYRHFSEKEKKIADYVLNDPKNIIHLTINQIADELGLAESTIFRFCQRIGFKGFQAFKISLAAEVVTPLKDIHEKIEEGDSISAVTEKVFRSNIKTLEDTLQIVDTEAMEQATDKLLKARKIDFYGNGGSAMVAMDGYHKFVRLGLQVSMNLDSHMQLMTASQLQSDDVAIVISHSGSTTDVLDVLRVLKEKGVTIICVTNFAKSPLSKEADIALYTISEETDFRSEALSSRIAQLSLIDALYTNLMIARGNEGKKALQDMREAMSHKRL
ncbi:RpiR family transcriptional regulator [Planococcus antarcticus DSM 14505]|uniref:RpiR family transcriptional regulator n=1 Tax=Planococcus antarcticus DSM 14505 TaxID=1185653 RepID=A0A1C7DDE9_9BACL|nr:MurR/RpiR family transcriptional regulator [Planococcus antarcticus]ANU09474.1 RpiR family transcriptional regulator [Planococcus antarcticus DSM 14505]EIM06249.1 RpiR family transcriptional regulator [Planococcus antarcticus DSM 14505]